MTPLSRLLALPLLCLSLADCTAAAPVGPAPAGSEATSSRDADASARKAVAQRQGGEYWAVYTVTAATQTEPAVRSSIDALSRRGLEFGTTFGFGSLGCDVGAAAALRATDDTNAVGVYFASEADAKAFAASLGAPALAIVKIKAMCRD